MIKLTTGLARPKYLSVARTILPATALLGITCAPALAAGEAAHTEDVSSVLLALVVILLAAKLGGDIFARLRQPAVLGELVFGVLVGNLYLMGFHGLEFIKESKSVEILSDIGVMLLLFQVGLESDIKKMMGVGLSALMVATLGVIAPLIIGWGVARCMLPNAGVYVHAFVGATLCATSVGITARVLKDLGRLQTKEARIILGAAVIDDVLGLIVLAVIVGIIEAASSGSGPLPATGILLVVLEAVGFLVGAILLGRWISPWVFRAASHLKASDLLLTTALGLCFTLAYLSKAMGLAPIVGAFAAGLILEEVHWRSFTDRGEHSVLELVKPLVGFLVPVFFVRMGAGVDLTRFPQPGVLWFAAALTIAAIIGKQVCGLGVLEKGLDRLSIGIGMAPRGEVGLIFAAIGSKLVMDGKPVVDPATFSAVVIMVVVTTMVTPPLLKWSMSRGDRQKRTRALKSRIPDAP